MKTFFCIFTFLNIFMQDPNGILRLDVSDQMRKLRIQGNSSKDVDQFGDAESRLNPLNFHKDRKKIPKIIFVMDALNR